jgi:hypothetical protein
MEAMEMADEFNIELEEVQIDRVKNFGQILAEAQITVLPDNIVQIVYDDGLKNRDKLIIEIDTAKVAGMVFEHVTKDINPLVKELRFLDGK